MQVKYEILRKIITHYDPRRFHFSILSLRPVSVHSVDDNVSAYGITALTSTCIFSIRFTWKKWHTSALLYGLLWQIATRTIPFRTITEGCLFWSSCKQMNIHNVLQNLTVNSRKKVREQVTPDENYMVAIFGNLHYIRHREFGGCGAAWILFIEVCMILYTHSCTWRSLSISEQFIPLLFNSLIILFLTPIYLLRNA